MDKNKYKLIEKFRIQAKSCAKHHGGRNRGHEFVGVALAEKMKVDLARLSQSRRTFTIQSLSKIQKYESFFWDER